MKVKTYVKQMLLLFLCFSSCDQNEDCTPPPCVPPNLNAQTSFNIKLCVDELDALCFTPQDLEEIEFITFDKVSNEVIDEETITNLDSMMYEIRIGQFGPDPTGSRVLERVEYYYLIRIGSIEKEYLFDDFKFDWSNFDASCDCPRYDFLSVQVNQVETNVEANTIELKK